MKKYFVMVAAAALVSTNIVHAAIIDGAWYETSEGAAIKHDTGTRTLGSDTYTHWRSNGTVATGLHPNGGGVIYNNAEMILNGTSFKDNYAWAQGGAIYNNAGARLTINGGIFEENNAGTRTGEHTSGYGGAISNNGAGAAMTINGTQFISNNAWQRGGAIYSQSGATLGENWATMNISNSYFYNNKTASTTATQSGGGAISNANRSEMWLTNNRFLENASYWNGGAISNINNARLHLTDNIFDGNIAGRNGGVIFNSNQSNAVTVNNEPPTITINSGNIFRNNSAGFNPDTGVANVEGYGGAIYNHNTLSAIGVQNAKITILAGNTFENNNARTSGGAIFNGEHGTLTLDSSGGTIEFKNNNTGVSKDNPNDIHNNGILNIDGNSGVVRIGSGISGSGVNAIIEKTGTGLFVLDKDSVNNAYTGIFSQEAGTTTVYTDSYFGGISNIATSTINLLSAGANVNLGTAFNLLGAANVNTINDTLTTFTTGSMHVEGQNKFFIDVDVNIQEADKFAMTTLTGASSGELYLAGINALNAATTNDFSVQVFDPATYSGVSFTGTGQVRTPVGIYNLSSQNNGWYDFSFSRYNPEVFRSQAAAIVTIQNQYIINNALFDNAITIPGGIATSYDNKKNLYAITEPALTGYVAEQGGLWFKPITVFETVHLTQGLNVKNTAYNALIGADFAPVSLKRGWTLYPMAYISYIGANQSYDVVRMNQNGGEAGFMTTFAKDDFRVSLLGYGGGFHNNMSGKGYTNNTNHWLAGGAVKTAYNFRPTESKRFTIQPNAMFTYNAFSGYDFMSQNLRYKTGTLHAMGTAPGINMIYERDSWSTYTTFSYLININDEATGSIGSLSLPAVKMRNGGYFEYGIGFTKKINEVFNSYIQATLRNGGRTGIAFTCGLNYKFDWPSFKHKPTPAPTL